MKIGIMSDSHGRIEAVRSALVLMDSAGAEGIVHCGDVGGIEVLEEFAGRRCWFVWGNTDAPHPGWRAYAESVGLPWPDGPLQFELAGRKIGVFHGHEYGFRSTVRRGGFDYLFYGHTHHRDDYRMGSMRVINPGALHRVAIKTVAVLDLGTDDLQFMELP
jgi:uncharacterized protein